MAGQHLSSPAQPSSSSENDQRSLSDMLQELRVLQQGSQILTGFLVLLPFSPGFTKIEPFEKWVYVISFVCSIISLVCFSAPAAQHRLERPLRHRVRFKLLSTRIIIAGLMALSVALVSTTQLVLAEVVGSLWSPIITALVGLLIGIVWWILPLAHKRTD